MGPEFPDKLPDNTLLIMQIIGDEKFNAWARQMGAKCAEEDDSVVSERTVQLLMM